MFGLDWIEFFIILIVALLVIGPDKLPEVARGLARLIRQFQRIANDVRNSVNLDDFEARMSESSHYTPPNHPKADETSKNIHEATPSVPVASVPPAVPPPNKVDPAHP
ncbi:MAG: twin-arginine translocase TatA/TatE family subunit [Magnetococcales bacterium]|nr:twin-arginine translocase TatA/TatE family subunit [Magnetococcales bacterium]MBF0437551.1 twin-arginine translocase TatA/TatE family subunit [Magnetococcales bacterium]